MTSSSLHPNDITIHIDHSTVNVVGRDQSNLSQDSDQASRQPVPSKSVNDAPLDLLSIHFTGRGEDLKFLQDSFSIPRSDIPSRCAVYGMPGLGKTQLMLRYAKLSFDQDRYSHIFWISATGVDKLNQGIAGILDLVEHHDRYHQDQKAKLTAARLWLEGASADWLLVFDNVNRATLDFLRVHLPRRNRRGNILFTTRTADVAEALVNAAGERHPMLQLKALNLPETANLFFQDAGIDPRTMTASEIVHAEHLVKCVGCLPLAVVQAASLMRQTQTSLDDMLELYEKEGKFEAIYWENDLSTYQERSVAATFSHQFDQLSQESRDVSNLLKILSFCDPETIPLVIITEGAKEYLRRQQLLFQPATSISSEFSSLITLILSPIQFRMAIQKLQQLSLVERRWNVQESSLWMHDLIQFMMQEGARREETYRDWLQLSVLLICGAFGRIDDPELPQRWAECEKFVPHLRSLNQRWDDVHDTNLELTRANVRIAVYLTSRARYHEAEELEERALERMKNQLGVDHPETLSCMSDLATVYRAQGRFKEAEALNEQTLAARERLLGVDHLDTLWSMNALAIVYRLQGRYHDAEKLQEQVMIGREKQLGPDHPDTLWSMAGLANVYRLQRRFDQAEKLHKRALEGREKQLGPDHPNTLWSIGALANVYRLQQRFGEAEELHKRALVSREKQLGADHPNTLWSVGALANVYRLQGRFDDAEGLHKRTWASMEKLLGADHPNTLWLMSDLASVYQSQGRSKESQELHERVLEGRQKQLGVNHPDALWSMTSLANIYESQGQLGKAEELHKQVLAGREQHLGTRHPDTLSSVSLLASVYRLQGRCGEAEELEKRFLVSTGR